MWKDDVNDSFQPHIKRIISAPIRQCENSTRGEIFMNGNNLSDVIVVGAGAAVAAPSGCKMYMHE